MDKVSLVAPGVKAFVDATLANCRRVKDTYINYAVNIGLTLTLCGIVGGFLYYRYRGKPSPQEVALRRSEAHSYIMKKLGNNVATRQWEQNGNASKATVGSITGLPGFGNPFEG
jgi:hypothetical protein